MVYKFLNPYKRRLVVVIALIAGCFLPATLVAQGQYYRFVNDEGVKVIANSIPPEHVPKGYEILNAAGQVIEVVPPAPKEEELERVAQEQELLEQYRVLARRYSAVKDILAARDRRLALLNADIQVLRSNINNLNNQIDDLMSKAANYERAGKKVPQHLFDNLAKVRSELASTEDKLQKRLNEHDIIFEEFEEDVRLFKEGRALTDRRRKDKQDTEQQAAAP